MQNENHLLAALRAGAVVVEYDSGYMLADSNQGIIVAGVNSFILSKDVKALAGNPDLIKGTAHVDNRWDGADDGLLRTVIFHVSNQAMADNVYRTSQVISNLNADVAHINAAISCNSDKPGVFNDLPLLAIFKFLPYGESLSVAAIKVGRSTAITGIRIDATQNLVNVLHYEFKGEKIRLRKNTMVVNIK